MTALSEIEQELKATFPSHSYQEWKEAADALLKGKPFEKLLVTPTYEGFDLQPIFRKEDLEDLAFCKDLPGAGTYVRGRNAAGNFQNTWKISQEQPAACPCALNEALKKDVDGGVDEINILLDVASQQGIDADKAASGEVGGCGLSLASLEDLEKALDGLNLKELSVFVQSGTSALAVIEMLKAYCAKNDIEFSELEGSVGADPIGALVRNGSLSTSIEAAMAETAEVVEALKGSKLGGIYVDGNVYHNAGSSASQELGFTIAAANEYLKTLTAKGLSVEEIASSMRFGLGVGGHFFLEVGKFRAARMLWARVLQAWGASFDDLPVHLHARTSIYNKTKIDPYANMLRVTSEAFSAVIGGCDSMHVGPFDEVLRQANDFSRRIARNVHYILAEECELTRVIDPAGGSYYIEWVTDQIAQKAWEWFQKVEAEGGLIEALKKGTVQSAISEVADKRSVNIGKRRDVIVGSNQYPNPTEELLEEDDVDFDALLKKRGDMVAALRGKASDIAGGATIGEFYAKREAAESATVEVLPIRRGSESYEKLRVASIEYAKEKGHGPKIFQANWGPSRGYRMRADWTSAFFQVAGFEMLNDTDYECVDTLVDSLKKSEAKIVVITSTDDSYAEKVVEIAKAVKAVDSDIYLMVAGMPGESEAAWREAGVEDFVNVRVNNYAMLEKLLKKLGVIS